MKTNPHGQQAIEGVELESPPPRFLKHEKKKVLFRTLKDDLRLIKEQAAPHSQSKPRLDLPGALSRDTFTMKVGPKESTQLILLLFSAPLCHSLHTATLNDKTEYLTDQIQFSPGLKNVKQR